jgi:hypothetical protein
VKLLILQLSVERHPATFASSNRTPTDLLPTPLRTFDTRQATTRPTAHGTAPPKRHVVQQRHPQVQHIVTDLLPIELSGVALVGRTALAPVGFTFNAIIYIESEITPLHTLLCLLFFLLLTSAVLSDSSPLQRARRLSHINPLFTMPPCTVHPVALHCRPSLRRPSPFIPPPFTLHSSTPRSSTLHSSTINSRTSLRQLSTPFE